MKLFIISTLIFFLLSSCGFLIYNYRAEMVFSYEVNLVNSEKNQKISLCTEIINLISLEKFYNVKINSNKDSINLYGPDYHSVTITLKEKSPLLEINVFYSGYNGNRRNPPLKRFFNNLDTLMKKYGANKIIIKKLSNEKF